MPKCYDRHPGPGHEGVRCLQAASIPPLGHAIHYALVNGAAVQWVNTEYVAPPRLAGRRDQEDSIQDLVVRSRNGSGGLVVPATSKGPPLPSDPDYATRLAPGPTKPYPKGEVAGPMLDHFISRGEEGAIDFHLEPLFPTKRPSTISSTRHTLAVNGWVVVTTRRIQSSGPEHTGLVAVYWERFNEMVIRTPPAALRAQPKDRPKGEVEVLLEEFD